MAAILDLEMVLKGSWSYLVLVVNHAAGSFYSSMARRWKNSSIPWQRIRQLAARKASRGLKHATRKQCHKWYS